MDCTKFWACSQILPYFSHLLTHIEVVLSSNCIQLVWQNFPRFWISIKISEKSLGTLLKRNLSIVTYYFQCDSNTKLMVYAKFTFYLLGF
jgi:hypothetical protein